MQEVSEKEVTFEITRGFYITEAQRYGKELCRKTRQIFYAEVTGFESSSRLCIVSGSITGREVSLCAAV